MRKALWARGLPKESFLEAPAGFRTLDSVTRTKSFLGFSRLTVITQEFHTRRTLFFCKRFQINAVALNADPVVRSHGWRLTCRELAARAVAVLNICLVRDRPNGGKIKATISRKMTARN